MVQLPKSDIADKTLADYVARRPYPIDKVRLFVKKYDECFGLDWYIRCCDIGWALSTDQQKPRIFETIKECLKTKTVYYEATKNIQTYDEFRTYLIRDFTEGKTLRQAKVEFGNCRQLMCEGLREYQKRLFRTAESVLLLMRYTGEYTNEEMDDYRNEMENTKFDQFLIGVGPSLYYFFKQHNPKNFMEAMSMVLGAEFSHYYVPRFNYSEYRPVCECCCHDGIRKFTKKDSVEDFHVFHLDR